MHIIEKILPKIDHALHNIYHINVDDKDWNLFKTPLTNVNNACDLEKFNKRQEKSIELIKNILEYHGKGDIVKFLAELADIEPKIQTLQPFVRDHVVHAINTFILGVYILEIVDFPSVLNTRFSYPFMWKLCGPTHDLGYPIEIAHNIEKQFNDKVNEILDRINSPSPRIITNIFPQNINELCNGIDANELMQQRTEEWDLGIDIENYYSWLKHHGKKDHGVISALAQLKVIDALYQKYNPTRVELEIVINGLSYNQKNFISDIVSSSSALFIHNISLEYPGFSNKIKFEAAPLAFLLFLCDTFQEWDRYSQKQTVFSGDNFNIVCERDSISLSVPNELEAKIVATLKKRLSGLRISVNNIIAVL